MMTASTAVERTDMPELKLLARGKVRDIYEVDEKSLLFVATDRLSAFDVVSIPMDSTHCKSIICDRCCHPVPYGHAICLKARVGRALRLEARWA
jgi:hypothetical protein